MTFLPSELTEYLLSRDVDLTVTTVTGDTILHGGVHGNQPEIVDKLIKSGKFESLLLIVWKVFSQFLYTSLSNLKQMLKLKWMETSMGYYWHLWKKKKTF